MLKQNYLKNLQQVLFQVFRIYLHQILKPNPTQEPENQVVTKGRSLTLSCFVNADKPVQYYWYKMSTLPSGDMTSDDNLYLAGGRNVLGVELGRCVFSRSYQSFGFPRHLDSLNLELTFSLTTLHG